MSWLPSFCQPEAPPRVLITGQYGSGKTSLLYRLHLHELVTTIPTIGFNVETVKYRNLTFNMWDLGGRSMTRQLHRLYYQGAKAVIYMIDTMDGDFMSEAADDLSRVVAEESLAHVPILLLLNKQDLPSAMDLEEVKKRFNMEHVLRNHDWTAVGCSVVTGEGIDEGMDWLCQRLGSKKSKLDAIGSIVQSLSDKIYHVLNPEKPANPLSESKEGELL
eukprot:TRINITY_DN100_c0_g1_i3.p1 TRINITY_DN100_c0_g1~~TRINITY_DN100_c0_g1_i3.p1  ORF type:complete len:218 (-),score=46.31 TRINITY_DN100_c0_g1_i3:318-971(-)